MSTEAINGFKAVHIFLLPALTELVLGNNILVIIPIVMVMAMTNW